MKKIITILAAVTIFSCSKQNKTIIPIDNYHVVITAKDTIIGAMLHGRLTIGNNILNIRKGLRDSTIIDTIITDNVSNGLSYGIYISKIQRNCSLKLDTTGNIKLNITSSTYTHSNNGSKLVQ